jgi:3-oxoacyl-[acyl-carrier protein] reductase
VPLESVYCATKHAQWGFSRALDRELSGDGIRVTAICPGAVATRFAFESGGRAAGSEELKRMMRPEDVAEAVVYALTRPRGYRVIDIGLLPMMEEF